MKPHRRKIIFRVVVPLGLGAVLVLALLWAGNFSQASFGPGTPTPTDPILASLLRQIDESDKILKKAGLPKDTAKKYQAKKKYLEQQATERADYLSHKDEALKIKQTAIINATLTPLVSQLQGEMPTPAEGLYTEVGNPRYREAIFSTLWIVHTKETYVLYFAGRLVKDPDQGVLYIEDRNDGTVKMTYSPHKDGSLKIKNVDKNRMNLESKKGRKYFFNMDKKKFVDEFDIPLPEVTPTPIPPYPSPE